MVLFFMEKWGEFITLCSCLGDNCHSSDIKVRATTSSFKACSTHIFLQSGNGVFPSFFKTVPEKSLPHGFLYKRFLKHKDGISATSLPLPGGAIKGPSLPLIFIRHLSSAL